MPERLRLPVAVGAAVLVVAALVAWLAGRGDDGAEAPEGRAPKAAEAVPAVDGEPTRPEPRWVSRIARKHAIPERAMEAYATAELLAERDLPDCGLHWNTIAAVGSVESAHGTLGGAGLDAEGVPDRKIIGPALNGKNGTRAIPATEASTANHGDDTWDHAVGPFQFLTSSWERYGADADGDGERDSDDIDDAAFGAAFHLCETAGGESRSVDGAGWAEAVFDYNNSSAYVEKVRGIADSFAE